MVWVYIALAILSGFFLLAHLLKFRFTLQLASPADVKASAGFSFLWIRKEFIFNRSAWSGSTHPGDEPDGIDGPEAGTHARPPASVSGQSGFIRMPESIPRRIAALRKRAYRALVKFVLDLPVWRILFRYVFHSGRRVLRLLRPSLEYLHVGMEDVLMMGGFAAVWSSLCGVFPSLACPVEYGFNERPASVQISLAGGFTGLNFFLFGLLSLFSFPWIPLGRRFVDCWRNPRLNRWQRRLLLF